MAWTSGLSITVGEVPTAAKLNALIANINYLRDIAYVEFTADVSITGTSYVDVVSSGAITYAATPIVVEFWAMRVTAGGAAFVSLSLLDGATDLGILFRQPASTQSEAIFVSTRLTPSAGSHTYKIAGINNAGQTSTVSAGAGGAGTVRPGFIRIRGIPS